MLDRYLETNNPKSYCAALADELYRQPREIAVACASPQGVTRECMFKPTVADLHRWCERESLPLRKTLERHDERTTAANLKAPADVDRSNRPTLDELRAKYGPTWGLKRMTGASESRGINDEEFEERERKRKAELSARAIAKTEAAILAEYRRLGREPVHAGDVLISPALFKSLGRALEN